MISNDRNGAWCLLRAEAIRITLYTDFQKVTQVAVEQGVRNWGGLESVVTS